MKENFADAPLSDTEIKSDKTRNQKDWTPRDVLISTLRRIDAGEIDPDSLTVVFRVLNDDGIPSVNYASSGNDPHVTMGMLTVAQFVIRGL